LTIDIGTEIHYLKQEMKNRRHRRLQDLLFLLLIIFLTGLIPTICSALSSRQKSDLTSKKVVTILQSDDDEDEFEDEDADVDEEEVEAPPVVTNPPQIRGVPPAQPIPPAQAPAVPTQATPPPAEVRPSDVKDKEPVKPAPSDLPAEVKPPEVKGEPPAQPAVPPAEAKPPEVKGEPFAQPAVPPAEAKPPEVKGEPLAQPAAPPAEAKPPEVKEEVPVRPAPPKPEKRQADVSFFFDDADVYEVIQTIFGEVLKVNYIVDPKIKGRVNFRTTTPIPRDDVLPVMEIILRLNGIAIVEEKGLYRIIALADIAKEPAPIRFGRDPNAVELKGIAIVQVVQLKYIGSSEIIKILTPLLSQGGSVLDVPPNFLIIADTDANVKRLLQVVDLFDSEKLKSARPQVFVYPVQNSKAKDVAAMLQQIFLGAKPSTPAPTAQPTTGRMATPAPAPSSTMRSSETAGGEALVSEATKIFADEITNTIIILATPEDFATISEAIKKIDIVPRQVLIEALVFQVDLTDNLDFGMTWMLQNNIKITGLKPFGNNDTVNLRGPLELVAKSALPPNFTFTAIDNAGKTKLLLQSLATEGRSKVLASPHILVADNREASIQVGSQVPLATQTLTTPTTTTELTGAITSSVQYKDIGIILKVKPQVNESGLVSLELSQEISSLGAPVKIADQDFSSINKTEAKTNLVAQDGQTIIIGGLIREDITQGSAGIPFLHKIPILKYLFGSVQNQKERFELIILLTPHVVRNIQEAKDITSDYVDRITGSSKQVTREELIKGLKREKEKKSSPSSSSP
jgi:type II secretory pathway component GspD/PulD (secretin)